MPIVFGCPKCNMKMQLPDNSVGKTFACPACKVPFTVPASAAPVTPSSPVVNIPAPVVNKPAAVPPPQPAPIAAAPKAAKSDSSQVASKPSSPVIGPINCPACTAQLLPGAISCMDCGYLLQAESTLAEGDGVSPAICTNPVCGSANPPGERNCQRCGQVLPFAAGHLINNRYRIEKQLAIGGFGAVYLATDVKEANRPVAIKDMICEDPGEFDIRLNFFRREADILKSLNSVSIVPKVYDLIEQGERAYLVLEFIKGKDLMKILESNGHTPFPIESVIEWGRSICDVLQHMHSQVPPLVHRDLKPENVMLLEDKKSIKMIDFGTARDLGKNQKDRHAAKTKVYTEGYAPLEQIAGKPEPRSDLFALACTLYQLATGKVPEGSITVHEIDLMLKDTANPIPAKSQWLYEMIKVNLSEDPNERYYSAREIKADLEKKQVTKEVPCSKCASMNQVRQPFCGKCAEPLTDSTPPCYYCGKNNRMGSRCCIHCGNRLR
jgi:predicted Ser/Thr protein kinase